MITQQRLRELLLYDPETGLWQWRTTGRGRSKDLHAGAPNAYGYRNIVVECERFYASRLAWLYMTGVWPDKEIDHIDGNPSNDTWLNLRLATSSQNKCNTKLRSNNTSGVRGVYWNERRQKWHARVNANYVLHHVGYFDNFDEAVAARDVRAAVLHGAYARFNNTDEGVRQ